MANVEFGTDGARGEWGSVITPETGYQVGVGVGQVIGARQLVLVQDTRPFNGELATAVKEGLSAQGVAIHDAGVLPTPAAAILADKLSQELEEPVAAISLSASHNPEHDAGIKVFGAGGKKLDDETTRRVEAAANNVGSYIPAPSVDTRTMAADDLRSRYVCHLLNTVDPDLRRDSFLAGRDIVFDGANGAAYWSTPYVLEQLGATVHAINIDPTAEINKDCGATHTEAMRAAVENGGAHYGLSVDGDADRVIAYDAAVDRLIDGDDALAIAAIAMVRCGQQPKGVAVTAYSNLGLELLLGDLGIPLIETDNGDRYVLEAMLAKDLPIGGENSGHTLYRTVAERLRSVLTGDGTLTALQGLQAAALLGQSPGNISNWPKLPHVLENIRLPKEVNAKELLRREHVIASIGRVASGYDGRLHTRASGTEPVIRILAKGKVQKSTDEVVAEISALIHEAAA